MALDPNIILQSGNFKTPDYATTLAQVANIKASGQEAKLRDLQISGVQRDDQTRTLLSKAFDPTTGEVDPVKAKAAFMASGDVAGARKFETDRLAAVNAQIDNAMKIHGTVSQILGGVTDQASLDAARAELGKNPALAQGVAQLPAQYDEAGAATIQGLIQQGQTVGEQLTAKKNAADAARQKLADDEAARHNKAMEGSNKVPAGYELGPTGALQPIKGGPNDPEVIRRNTATRTTAEVQAKKDAIDPNDPAVESYADQIYDNALDFRNVAPEYKTHVVNYMEGLKKAAEAEGKDPKIPAIATARLTRAAQQISSGYTSTSQYKLAVDGLPYIERIKAAASQKASAISDSEMLDSLTKMNTGGNAITDAQVRLVTSYGSYSDMLNVLKNRITAQGGSLSDAQRKDIVKLADATYDNYQKGYGPLYDDLARKLRASRIPENLWPVPDFNKLATQVRSSLEAPQSGAGAGGGPNGAETKTLNGVTYHKVKGQWMQ